jgi:DNA-binding NarL/FixJ family response regulator
MPEPPPAAEKGSIDVWLIDDNDVYTSVMGEALNLFQGVTCTSIFPRCEPAFELLRNGSRGPNVLLLDIGLPGVSGIHAIKTFRELSPRLKIIMLTVHDADDSVVAALKKGASGYLLKTSAPEDVVKAIRATGQGGMPLDPMVTRSLLRGMEQGKGRGDDYNLSEREREVLRLMVEGLTIQPMADRLFISPHTVISHIRHINEKLKVHSRSQAVVKAIKENLI